MLRRLTLCTAGVAAVLSLPPLTPALTAQGVPIKTEDMPLTKDLGLPSGLDVTPAWEGWYPNPDGTATIYFGYYNRNRQEVIHIPAGPDNQVAVAGEVVDAGQPTVFDARRNYGVFGVKVPGDFSGEVVWTLKHDGREFTIPGNLNPVWMTDQLAGDADGNFGPMIRFAERGTEGQGPLGVWADRTLTATVGQPLDVTVWGTHIAPASGEGAAPADTGGPGGGVGGGRGAGSRGFRVEWDQHAGPGSVTFSPANATIPDAGGMATTSVTFDTPGAYVLRVTASQGSVAANGHSQCCWTNGYVRVTVR
jgi:hypothetical protein